MRLPVYAASQASPKRFVSFWAQHYRYAKESLYNDNIGKPLTPDRIQKLFEWKNGSPLSALKANSVEKNYIGHLAELRKLPLDTDAKSFLSLFFSGGAIWRVFWLHCWQPERFPIYDQHVHRAMSFIERGSLEEIPKDDASKERAYLDRYLQFHRKFTDSNLREVDRALWFFGKFIKTSEFSILQRTQPATQQSC